MTGKNGFRTVFFVDQIAEKRVLQKPTGAVRLFVDNQNLRQGHRVSWV
jgi:hypothetical protein